MSLLDGVPSVGLRLVGLEVTALQMTEGPRRLSHRPGATLTHAAISVSGVHEAFVALEMERLCKFVSLVMFVPGEHYSGALQAQSSSAY